MRYTCGKRSQYCTNTLEADSVITALPLDLCIPALPITCAPLQTSYSTPSLPCMPACPCITPALPLQCPCVAPTTPLRCPYKAAALPLQSRCVAPTMLLLCPYNAAALPLQCCCIALHHLLIAIPLHHLLIAIPLVSIATPASPADSDTPRIHGAPS